jgi:branched-chain amino acid transport system substrate-binding protein
MSAWAAETPPRSALLLPLTGASADLALSMTRAAALAQPADRKQPEFLVLDTAGTAEGASVATGRAVAAGVGLILGPVFVAEVGPVVTAAAGRPVLAFSNDAAVRDTGAFSLGITASQGVSAILAYARSRGVRRVAVLTDAETWSVQSLAAARAAAARLGVEIFEADIAGLLSAGEGLAGQLTTASGGSLPDAVMACRSDPASMEACARIVELGVQLLGPSSWSEGTGSVLGTVEGAWFAAPDPAAFTSFAQTYEARHSSAPGLLAALAFDAAGIARRLTAAGRLSRDGLLAPEGFQGALGAVRFSADGGCARELAIQVVSQGSTRVVARATGQ